MAATKLQALWKTGSLDDSLEALLLAYARSVGGSDGGVPRELFDGASRIAVEHATIHAAGPANCTPSKADLLRESNGDAASGETQRSATPAQLHSSDDTREDPADATQQSAAVLDGGMDDITPVRIWDAVMKKYRLAQQCDQELARIDSQANGTKREELLRQRVVAIAAAVDALAKLHQKETIARLQKMVQQHKGQIIPVTS